MLVVVETELQAVAVAEVAEVVAEVVVVTKWKPAASLAWQMLQMFVGGWQ